MDRFPRVASVASVLLARRAICSVYEELEAVSAKIHQTHQIGFAIEGVRNHLKSGADGGTRTRTPIGRGILSPVRLPISPRPRVGTGRAGARLGQARSWKAMGAVTRVNRMTSVRRGAPAGVRRVLVQASRRLSQATLAQETLSRTRISLPGLK